MKKTFLERLELSEFDKLQMLSTETEIDRTDFGEQEVFTLVQVERF